MIEYDSASQWYATFSTFAAGWILNGGRVHYNVGSGPPDDVRAHLKMLGLNVGALEADGKLILLDWYTATLGQKSKEKYAFDSLKVADLSIRFSKAAKGEESSAIPAPVSPDVLRIHDDISALFRFNDEKSTVEFLLTRFIPHQWKGFGRFMAGAIRGIHSDWVYSQLEAQCHGVIDLKLDETSSGPANLVRIRTLRNVGFDPTWHELRVGDGSQVTLAEKRPEASR